MSRSYKSRMKQTVGKKKLDFSVKSLPKTNIMALNQKILEIKKWVIFSGLRRNIDKLKTQPPTAIYDF